jgi:hypothetical protein
MANSQKTGSSPNRRDPIIHMLKLWAMYRIRLGLPPGESIRGSVVELGKVIAESIDLVKLPKRADDGFRYKIK